MLGLNLASGDHADVTRACFPWWVNVDQLNLPHWPAPPDVIASALGRLPFRDSCFDAVYLGHFLEHLDPETDMPQMFEEVRRVCKNGAGLGIVGPDYDRAVATGQPEWLLEIIRPHVSLLHAKGTDHLWLSTGPLTLKYVRDQIDPDAEEINVRSLTPPVWPNASDAVWQFAIIGTVRK